MRDGGLSESMRKSLLSCIRCALSSLPKHFCFDVDMLLDQIERDTRIKMMNEFEILLSGGKGELSLVFRIEGVTILIPLGVAFHQDTNNSEEDGLESVVQINCKVPMTANTIKGGRESVFWMWLELNGYESYFPCSIILYTRKIIDAYMKRILKMQRFSAIDPLRRCIAYAVMNRVDSVVDYEYSVWNNSKFIDDFKDSSHLDVRTGERTFKGKLI